MRGTARRREGWRLVAAGALGGGALLLPWSGLELSPGLSAWALPVSLASVPLVGHVSYGAAVSLLLLGALASSWRAGWARTATVRWCGLALVITPLLFVVTTRVSGSELLFRLGQSSNEISFLARNGATISQTSPTTTFLGFGSDATTVLLLRSLRLGWPLCVAAGAVMAGARRLPRPRAIPAAGRRLAGALVVISGLVCGLVGQADKLDGVQALASGRPAVALADIQNALSLSPQLAYDAAVPQTVGQADLELGRPSADAYFAEATAQPAVNQPAVLRDVGLLAKAFSLAPGNAVIAAQYDQLLASGVAQSGPLVFHFAAQRPSVVDRGLDDGPQALPPGGQRDHHRVHGPGAGRHDQRRNALVRPHLYRLCRRQARPYSGVQGQHRGRRSQDDGGNVNVLAREAAAGLFLPSWA